MEVQKKINRLASYLTFIILATVRSSGQVLTLSSCWLLALEVEKWQHLAAYKQVQKDQGLKKTSQLSVSCSWTQMSCGARPGPARSCRSLADGYWLQPNVRAGPPSAALRKMHGIYWSQAHHCLHFESAWCLGTGTNNMVLHLCWVPVDHAERKLEQILPSLLLTPAQDLN